MRLLKALGRHCGLDYLTHSRLAASFSSLIADIAAGISPVRDERHKARRALVPPVHRPAAQEVLVGVCAASQSGRGCTSALWAACHR